MQGNLRSSIEKVHITPCHCHPMSLDSANTVQYFVETAAKELGKKAISFTDHGTISAILEGMDVSKNLKKKNNLDIKVIPGVELYMTPEPWDTTKKSYYHLTVHMDDFETYLKFCKLSKTAHDRAIINTATFNLNASGKQTRERS